MINSKQADLLKCYHKIERLLNNMDHIIDCQKTGKDLFYRKVKSKKIDKTFFPKDLLVLMEENPKYYFGPHG